jgi:stearoyl-CoA desaturase (delta-9 desaturase)
MSKTLTRIRLSAPYSSWLDDDSLWIMTKLEKRVNLLAVAIPFAGTLAAIVLLWNSVVSITDLAILGVMYVATGLGVTVGFHRLLTHRSFLAPKPVEYLFAALGSMAVQGPVMAWVADHRKHHAHADQEGDPHSPHVGHGDGVAGVLGGLWHAHVGWLLSRQGQASARKYAPDLFEDRGMRVINRRFPLLVLLSLAVPALAGWALTGTIAGAATGLLWGGLVRIFLVHHVTWSVNSVCHFLGRRRFETDDESTNVAWLALPSFGESWHHNHHAFPRSATHGLRRWERALDPSGLVIAGLEKLGLARNVVRIAPERQVQRQATPAPMRAAAPRDA